MQGCGTSRGRYSPDTEILPPLCGHRQPIKSSPGCPVGGQSERDERANHSLPSSEGGRLEDKDVSRLLCSEHAAFLVSTEAFLTLTWALWCDAKDTNSSHTHTDSWRIRGENNEYLKKNEEIARYIYGLSADFWIYDLMFDWTFTRTEWRLLWKATTSQSAFILLN